MPRVIAIETRQAPRDPLADLADRVRRIELVLAFMAGGMFLGGGAIGAKIFGLLG